MYDPRFPHRVAAILEKLPATQAPSTFALDLRFVVTPEGFDLREHRSFPRVGELWFSDASNQLAKIGIVLTQAFEGAEDWLTTGDPLRWLIANITLALNDPNLKDSLTEFIKKLT